MEQNRQEVQPTLEGAAFERRVLRGLITPRAYVAAVLESVGSWPSVAADHGVSDWASDYAEPGYTAGERGILFGNWNETDKYDPATQTRVKVSDKPCRFAKVAEHAGFSIEWEDEWSTCHGCGKAVRTSPDSYSYTPSYAIVNECELLCVDCLASDPEGYLEELTGNEHACLSVDLHREIDLAAYGFRKWNDSEYESGWHPGQTDDPRAIAKQLRAQGIDEFLFVQAEQSQFYIKFDVYVREQEQEQDEEQE